MVELTNEQKKVHDSVVDWVTSYYSRTPDKEYISVAGLAGSGKQQPIDCLIQTPNGPIEIGKLKIGDYVFGRNGKPTKVIGVFPQGVKQAYKITFRDGFYTEAGEDHLWSVWNMKSKRLNKPLRTMTTNEILKSGLRYGSKGPHKYCIPLCEPVEYQEKELPIHPYLLGLFIGDGTSLGKTPTLCIPNFDSVLIDYVKELIPEYITIKKDTSSNCDRYLFLDKEFHGNRLNKKFKELGLNINSIYRFIPQIYKQSSIKQRYQLLNGLMDTDGSCTKNRSTFSTSSEKLANDIIELVQSLGGIGIKHYQKRNGEILINIKTFKNPFKLPRKGNEWCLSYKNPPSRYIFNIEPSRIVEQVCIAVEADDKLYLTDNYIVTHNTTLIGFITDTIKNSFQNNYGIAYITYTGKASLVLKSKVKADYNDYVGTIHSLIYKPIIKDNIVVGWMKKGQIDYDLIIVDEGSMVGKDIWKDLISFKVPIIVVGDHGQLPPVGDTNFSLMNEPDLILKEIHRQALENPIIKLSFLARKEGKIPQGVYGKTAAKIDWLHEVSRSALNNFTLNNDTQILCGMNKTRVKINSDIRTKLNFDRKEPCIGERLICLLNNKEDMVMNGSMGITKEVKIYSEHLYDIKFKIDGFNDESNLLVYKGAFGKEKYDAAIKDVQNEKVKKQVYDGRKLNLFDFGYCISVHKSQGSEWDKIILIEERNFYQSDEDFSRWLYTGITRAKNKLLIIDNYF